MGKEGITCYENREISWLKFNQRVLEKAADEKARELQSDGNYVRVESGDTKLDSQKAFCEIAYEGSKAVE